MSTNIKYTNLLNRQIKDIRKENHWLEFKSNYQEADRLGRYISALSNGACLDHEDFAYLYFGVDDETLCVKGTTFDVSKVKAKGNQSLELYLRQYITPCIPFEFEEFLYNENVRVVRLRIPAAAGEPVSYFGKPYIRVDSHTTELTRYTDWMKQIYLSHIDWSAQIVEDATNDDLDQEAIAMAKKGYAERYPQYADELKNWSDEVFLDKACLTLDGMITRATMLLVGKREKAHKLSHISEIVWKCHQDGQTFGDIYTIPFILSTSALMNRIRNYRFKIYPQNSLIPAEVWKYDTRSILEGLHNCVAHQNYAQNERIIVTEDIDKLTFENAGGFYDGDFDQYVYGTKTPRHYRNPALMKAMVNVKMIDSQGYGIHNMFVRQKERFLPMPDYNGTTESKVVLHLPGIVIDTNYSLLLMSNNDLTLTEVVLLDSLQKGKRISDEAIDMLRKKKLVEGRKPNVYVAKAIAQSTNTRVEYSKHKGLNDKSCEALLIDSLKEHKILTRTEIDKLLWNALSDKLTDTQKKRKIGNLLAKLKDKGVIINYTRGSISEWRILAGI
ncbi:MAG: putative DNA binding domain-containing protein [Muribaculaceae bacterium]|nr:putative DNA binding domain-containing protein [Muribaculaceae bacterium]